jgi:hypothetical protein
MDNSPAIISYKAQLGKIKAQIKQMTTYPTQHLIELAYAAYRINKGYIKQTRRYSEGQPTTFSNKEMITFTAHSDWKPEDFVPLKVTDADRAAKVAGDKHMRRYTMLAMGNLPDFEADLFAAYSSSEMPIGRVGLVAYLPAFIERQVAEKVYKQRIKTEFAESKHLVGDRIEPSEVEILKVIPLNNDFYGEPAYLHFGAIGKDLVCFTVKQMYAVGDTYDIVARIKGEDLERDSKTPMTRLNYVKLRKQEI